MNTGLSEGPYEALNEGGWNLLELMIALLIISIGLLGTAAMLAGIIRGNQVSKNVTIATILAKDQIEYLNSIPYSELPSVDTTATEDYSDIPDYPGFKRVTKTFVNNPSASMKTVVVEVTWQAGANPVVLPMIYEQQ